MVPRAVNDGMCVSRRLPIRNGELLAFAANVFRFLTAITTPVAPQSACRGDAVSAFLQGEDKGQLDSPKAREGGFAGGLFAIFVPSTEKKPATNQAPAPDFTVRPNLPASI